MSNPEPHLPAAKSAFAPHLRPGRQGASGGDAVTLTEIPRQMVTVQARRGRSAALEGSPPPGRAATDGSVTIYAIAPETWLVAAPSSDRGFIAGITETVGQSAAVVDQSHGKATLRVSGARVRDVLDKICRLDLHPTALTPGSCGITEIAHTAVLIARADDGAAGSVAAFDLIIPSTFAIHVLEAVETAAREFGVVVV